MKNQLKYFLPVVFLLGLLSSCSKEYESIETVDKQNIEAYIKSNNLDMRTDPATGVYYQVLKPGTGPDLDYTKQLPIIFTARSIDGKYSSQDTFASTNRFGRFFGYFALPYGGPPEALRNAVKSFLKKEAGSIRVILPSNLAFGKAGYPNVGIEGNQAIDYTVKVLNVADLDKYDEYQITRYMTANNLTGFTKSADGIYYKISDPGTGSPIAKDSIVTATYTGKLLNGTVFDQAPAATPVNLGYLYNLIPAWNKILPLIKEGGSVRFITPSKQGYGLAGTSNGAYPFTCMDFDMKVTDVSR